MTDNLPTLDILDYAVMCDALRVATEALKKQGADPEGQIGAYADLRRKVDLVFLGDV